MKNKPFSERLQAAHKETLRYHINQFNKACSNFYDAINDWLRNLIFKS